IGDRWAEHACRGSRDPAAIAYRHDSRGARERALSAAPPRRARRRAARARLARRPGPLSPRGARRNARRCAGTRHIARLVQDRRRAARPRGVPARAGRGRDLDRRRGTGARTAARRRPGPPGRCGGDARSQVAPRTARDRRILGSRPRALRSDAPRMALATRASDRKPGLQPERHTIRDRDRGRRRFRGTAPDARRPSSAGLVGIRSSSRPAPPLARPRCGPAVRGAIDARGADRDRRRRAEGRRCRGAGTTDVGRGTHRGEAHRRARHRAGDPAFVLGLAQGEGHRSSDRRIRAHPRGRGALMAELAGHVAIVTGAGRGLGRAVAERLAAMGAAVVIASRNAPELDEVAKAIKRAKGRALAQTADIADERQVQELVLATERWVGPATILVNNAGMVDPMVPLARSNAALWLRSVAINVGGTYLVTRAALPGMLDRSYGRIVTISSGAATRPSAGWTAYAAGKAAV